MHRDWTWTPRKKKYTVLLIKRRDSLHEFTLRDKFKVCRTIEGSGWTMDDSSDCRNHAKGLLSWDRSLAYFSISLVATCTVLISFFRSSDFDFNTGIVQILVDECVILRSGIVVRQRTQLTPQHGQVLIWDPQFLFGILYHYPTFPDPTEAQRKR